MFGLFKKKEHKEAANKIGIELHRQIFDALKENESEAGVRISSPFVAGYLYGFVRIGFGALGYDGEKVSEKYFKYICNGILPKKLYEIFERQLAALELAKDLGREEEGEMFELGVEVGVYDSGSLNTFSSEIAENLYKYLTGQELQYKNVL
jgi:hypothetical protein